MRNIKAVLFDFDGTLADTMEDNYVSWRKVLSPRGCDLKEGDYYHLEGTSPKELVKKYEKIFGKTLGDPHKLYEEKDKAYKELNRFKLYDGVESLISSLRDKGISLGIVTAGKKKRIFDCLDKEFIKNFDVFVTGDEKHPGKPAPDPYLRGAKLLSLDSAECLVVENAPLGVLSAKNANMLCIAITSTVGSEKLSLADFVVSDIKKCVEYPQFP